MFARPREKEFMIGHPAFFLAVMAVYRHWPRAVHLLFVLGATIGQGSLVQTFAHMRTPVFMSFVRAWDGYVCGDPVRNSGGCRYAGAGLFVQTLGKETGAR